MRYRFEGLDLDEEVFALRRDDVDVALRPQALDVLLYLIKNRDRLVTKSELLKAIWKDTAVSDNTLMQAVTAIRRAVGDDDEAPKVIQTVRARGYRFIATLVEPSVAAAAAVAHELVVRAVPIEPPTPAGSLPSKLAGRDALVRRFDTILDDSGAPLATILLSGVRGIGKTRLLTEIEAHAKARGYGILRARCQSSTEVLGMPDLWPWIELLRSGGDDLATVANEIAKGVDGDNEAQFRSFDRVAQALERCAKTKPLLVMIDDLHDADVPSLLLLKLVATSLARSRIVLALAYRDGKANAAFARTLGALAREETTRSFPIEALERQAVGEIARAHFAASSPEVDGLRRLDAAEQQIVDRLMTKSAGNPLLIIQMLHAMTRAGAEKKQDGSTSALLELEEMREAIALQLEDLDDKTRAMLSAASVLGIDLTLPRLARITELELTELTTLIEQAIAAKVLVPTTLAKGERGFRFLHVLVRDVLYRKLRSNDRTRLHRSAGLAALNGGDDDGNHEIAIHHFERALRELGGKPREARDNPEADARALLADVDAALA